MKEIIIAVRKFLQDRFNLNEDKADEQLIIESIERNVNFKGTNLWTLIFAILIASIGLNVNSTAVIIGAMLISPLMGPIMGVGLGIGILDFELMKKGIKNLFIAALFSVITSFLYFLISPLQEAKTEILARTTPSLWDVLIAFFGGLAGIIAGTRKEKGNVLAGVAIATALMPPLCTAGFGLAVGHWYYFFGALYLFFINSLFICMATFIIVRYLKFKVAIYATAGQRKRVMRSIFIIVVITLLPSIYLAIRIVQKTIFEQNARNFVQNEFRFDRAQVVNRVYKFNDNKSSIELLLIGQELSKGTIDSLRRRMHLYNLDSNWLTIRQGLNAKKEIDLAQIKASILQDVFVAQRDSLEARLSGNKSEKNLPDLHTELHSLYPDMKEFSLTQAVFQRTDTIKVDTVVVCIAMFTRYLTKSEKTKMTNWLKERTASDSVRLIIEREMPKK
ncbi:MAG: TIGR00341 family protein [Bacteroidetes bacterium]|nr:MAG: TIGR00341 family protein [Bacteroidota bacterium]